MIQVDMGNDGYVLECQVDVDGDKYCVQGINWDFVKMPVGFGSTIGQAIADFKNKLRNEVPCFKQARPKNVRKTT